MCRHSGTVRRWILLAICCVVAGIANGEDGVDHISAVRTALEKDDAPGALQTARLGLEYLPDSVELLELASQAAEKSGEKDTALWYTQLALDLLLSQEETKETEDAVQRLTKRAADLDPHDDKVAEIIDGYAEELISVADGAQRRKLYANAVDLYLRCESSSLARKASEKLDRFYGNKKAVEILLASGIDVPVRDAERISPERLASMDAKHAAWERAYEFKGPNYTIRTDMGYEMGTDILQAMEQIQNFYRKVFGKKPGQRCNISVYRTRAEFDEHEGERSPSIKGFFRPGQNYVATYDPVSDGLPQSFLWSTLFHEASHQFTERVSTGTIPAWLNEGTASYFEGARLMPGGVVETNLIPDTRLRGLRFVLEEGSPTLKDVVSFFRDGSYPGSYYPVGWGLVYFLQNYEDDKCERVYVPYYDAYLKSYSTGGQHDPVERFEQFFIDRPKQEGVKTFADFEEKFKSWIFDLHDLHFGPSSGADQLIERARKQKKHDKLDAAAESYRWALRKRSTDPVAAFELAEVLAEQKDKDAALYTFRKAKRLAREVEDPAAELRGMKGVAATDLVEMVDEQIADLDRGIAKGVAESEGEFIEQTRSLVQQYADDDLPRRALYVLKEAQALVGYHPLFARSRENIAIEFDVDPRRWRRLRVDSELSQWTLGSGWEADGEGLTCDADSLMFAFYRDEPPEDFYFETEVELTEPKAGTVVGLAYAVGQSTTPQLVALTVPGKALLIELRSEAGPEVVDGDFGSVEPGLITKKLKLAIDVERGRVRLLVNGIEVGKKVYDPQAVRGGIGVFVQRSVATFREMRLRY
ncbi:MAG: DUF1570 domain-containing protein [Planctomycetota bacterium]